MPGKFVFRVQLTNKSPLTLDHNATTRWEIHFSHVYGVEDFVAALNGIELFDHYTQQPVGLDLFRYGGFYWKFMTNDKWNKLEAGKSFSFTLLGNNWMSSSSANVLSMNSSASLPYVSKLGMWHAGSG